MNCAVNRPRRSLRSEIPSLTVVAAVQAAVLAVFPSPSASPRHDDGRPAAGGAFIELSEAEEARVVTASRTAWHVDAGDVRRMRADMFESLPETPHGPVAGEMAARRAHAAPAAVAYEALAVPTDMRAPPPAALPKSAASTVPAFSRENLLSLDGGL